MCLNLHKGTGSTPYAAIGEQVDTRDMRAQQYFYTIK